MKKTMKKALAILLSMIIAFSFSLTGFAADDDNPGEPYSPLAHFVDGVFGVVHDALFRVLETATRKKDIPDYEEFMSGDNHYYTGTDGKVTGDGWSGGFASQSIIPESWRCDANLKPDPEGYNLYSLHATGGYQTYVKRLYTDQMLNMIILSNGTDSNNNGIDDIIIFANVDGIGITADTCRLMRSNAENALSKYGVVKEDILSFNVSATHCHAALDTQGMSILMILFRVFTKTANLAENNRTLNRAIEKTLCEKSAVCADNAYSSVESGSLYFFETSKVNYTHDKNSSGVKNKNTFSCFLFESQSGEKTLITNIGAHPTGYGAWNNKQMMCADYPSHMTLALNDAGYNIVFTQSAQAAISSPGIAYEEGSQLDIDSNKWVSGHSLTKEDWVERYGQKYADKWYDELEADFESDMKEGYRLAHHIIDASDKKAEVAPVLNIRNSQILLPLDNGLLGWGSISGLLGENVVKMADSESGYGNVVEINYLEIGNDVVILTAPGELSPSLVYGSDPEYTGTNYWNGKTSWTGETWQYDMLENIVRQYTGDEDKTVLVYGITNDALGYMYPDNCTTKSLLAIGIFFRENADGMMNDMMLTTGQRAGSSIMAAYTELVKSVNE